MSIQSTLKREGIHVIGKLNTLEINKIASNISEKICNAFPEHNINQSDLFISIARLDMYVAEMPNDMAMAKYFYKNNSIYFSKDVNFNDLHTLALHECLHFIQELKNKNGKLLRMGLYNLEGRKHTGLALNEASVQLMASYANNAPLDSVKYYNMEITTESPDFYPLQTALLKQIIYFTGTYPLFHSTLYSNDIFKNTFIEKSNAKTYNQIEYNFDLIMHYESKLSEATFELSTLSEELKSVSAIRKINERIDALKAIILEKTLETQNLILVNCFDKQFENIKTINDIKQLQSDIYNFKHVLIDSESCHFYNDYYIDMMNKLEEKREFIAKYGEISSFDIGTELSILEEHTYGFKFFKTLFSKLSLLLEDYLRAKDF